MLHVLELAHTDATLRARGPAADQLRAAARVWLLNDDDAWPLSFLPICWHFGIDAHAVRAAVGVTGGAGPSWARAGVVQSSSRRHRGVNLRR